ncbi:unnamed protein product, partial [Ectocarpus sp. 12 AP-2014]
GVLDEEFISEWSACRTNATTTTNRCTAVHSLDVFLSLWWCAAGWTRVRRHHCVGCRELSLWGGNYFRGSHTFVRSQAPMKQTYLDRPAVVQEQNVSRRCPSSRGAL